MSVFHNNALIGASGQAGAGAYEIERSLRFNSADSAYLNRTPGSAGNRKTWTWAGWVKRSGLGTRQFLASAYFANALYNTDDLMFTTGDSITYWNKGDTEGTITTAAVFRDCSAWYHIVLAYDSTQSTASDRVKLYVNGAQVTTFSTATYPSQNRDSAFNSTNSHQIARRSDGSENASFNGYLADVHFIDGQALDPTSFGEFDTNGVWQPKAYSGSYGTNGFHLTFSDNSTAAALGTDTSGNNHTWTVNNISVAAGAGNDSLVDTPTNYGTDTGAGGEVRGNYCTWNPLINGDTAANGNLDVTNDTARGTHKLLDYDAYWEITSTGGTTTAGVVSDSGTTNTTTIADTKTYGFKLSTTGSLDYINITDGGSFTSITTGLTGVQFPYASAASATTGSLNTGQRPFAATAPSGFKALCTTNLPEPTIADGSTAMDVVLDTGANILTAAQGAIGGSADLLWIKDRANANNHQLIDTVRGGTLTLQSNTTAAETTYSAPSGSSVAWTWDAGSSTVTNNDGSIASQVRANPSAGFSVVAWTKSPAGAHTVGHGLGIPPQLVIVKSRAASEWAVYHASLGATKFLKLNTTDAAGTVSAYWNDTAPTSTTISLGSWSNLAGDNIAYCFAPVAGYSAFGSYTGNGSADGPFVYTGFRPRWVLVKAASGTSVGGDGYWNIADTARAPYNWVGPRLAAQSSVAEDLGSTQWLDILSNGFKMRAGGTSNNNSGTVYIYAAFAESPFQYARAR